MNLWVLYFYRANLKDIPATDYLWSLGILVAPIAVLISLFLRRLRARAPRQEVKLFPQPPTPWP